MKKNYSITTKEDFKKEIKNSYDTGKSIAFDLIPPTEWDKASKDFSQGNEKLAEALQTMWKCGISTWACSSEKGIEYVSFFIDSMSRGNMEKFLETFCSKEKNVNLNIFRRQTSSDGKNLTTLSLYNTGDCNKFFENITDSILDMALVDNKNFVSSDDMIHNFCKDADFIKNLDSNTLLSERGVNDLEKYLKLTGVTFQRLKLANGKIVDNPQVELKMDYVQNGKTLNWCIIENDGEYYEVLDNHSAKLRDADGYVAKTNIGAEIIGASDLGKYPVVENETQNLKNLCKSYKVGELDKFCKNLALNNQQIANEQKDSNMQKLAV